MAETASVSVELKTSNAVLVLDELNTLLNKASGALNASQIEKLLENALKCFEVTHFAKSDTVYLSVEPSETLVALLNLLRDAYKSR